MSKFFKNLQESNHAADEFDLTSAQEVYRGLYSHVYRVRMSDSNTFAALKIFLSEIDGSIDINAAVSYVKRVESLRESWPENGRVRYPRIIRDFSTCGIVIMEWVDAKIVAANVRPWPRSNKHLSGLTRMAAMWLRNFHSAVVLPGSEKNNTTYDSICSDIVKLSPLLLEKKYSNKLSIIVNNRSLNCNEKLEKYLTITHGDYGIHNVLTSGEYCFGIDFTWGNVRHCFVDIAFFVNSLHRKILFKGQVNSNRLMDELSANFIDVYDCGENKNFAYYLTIFQIHEVLSFFNRYNCDHKGYAMSLVFGYLLKRQVNYLFHRIEKLSDTRNSLEEPQ